MKRLTSMMLGVAVLLVLSGCAMKEFSSTPFYTGSEVKFTGAVEDRVNLWPVAYWREPVGSLAWPFISWGDDHLALRPLYSQYKQDGSGDYDEFNFLWPISQFDTEDDDYRVFPFFWGKSYGDEPYFCLFPVLWWNDDFKGVMPFWRGDKDNFGVFPLYWHINIRGSIDTLFPLYGYWPGESSSGFWAFCGLAGYERQDGKLANHRFLPFYLWADGDFYSLPYSRYKSDGLVKSRVLCGLAGGNSNIADGYEASWLFPLYYHDKSRFVTPLFGKAGESYWLLPLYYHDKEVFVTPLYGRCGDAEWLFPLFYRDDESFVTPLYGRNKQDGSDWLIPLYYRDNSSFLSIPFGYREHGSYTNTYFAAGLAGVRSGSREGGWLFPLFNYRKHADFDEKEAWMDVVCAGRATVNPSSKDFSTYNSKTHLLLSDNDKWIFSRNRMDATNLYELTKGHRIGNRMFFRYEGDREVAFDMGSGKKVSDSEEGETSLLMFLYNGEHRADHVKGTSYTSHRVLWKLWDWEEENGDVSLDVFPGFTYDSKKNGYRKTSFLWRLFRYENDPKEGKKVDLLFLPVWR